MPTGRLQGRSASSPGVVRRVDADVLVAGAGPAGLALAAFLAGEGLGVVVASPGGLVPWPATYGVWADDLAGLGLPPPARLFPEVTVDLGEARPRRLARAYGLLDNAALVGTLAERLQAGGGRVEDGAVAGVEPDRAGAAVHLAGGDRPLVVRVVVDATGAGGLPGVVAGGDRAPERRSAPGRGAAQAAFGLVARVAGVPPVPPGGAVLMDWRPPEPGEAARRDPDPTFLYGFDLGGGRVFVEETSLARRPPLGFDELERRLRARLAGRGTQVVAVEHVERCFIPLDVARTSPPSGVPVVAFGAAGGLVHPATGYQVGRALRAAPQVAETLAAGLRAAPADPGRAAQAAHAALWPLAARVRRGAHRYGLEVLLDLDTAATQAFFGAFFDQPRARWVGYLGDAQPVAGLVATMAGVFVGASPALRRALLRPCLGPGRWLPGT